MAPRTAQRATFHENGDPDSWSVVDRVFFYAEDQSFHSKKEEKPGINN
jgi:hypothetical protein